MAIEFFDTSNVSDYEEGVLLAYDHYNMHRETTASNLESLLAMYVWMPWAKHIGGFSDRFLEGYKNSYEVIGNGWVCLLKNLPTVEHPKDPMLPFPDAYFPVVHPDTTRLPRKDFTL